MTAGSATTSDKRAELGDRLLRKRRQEQQDNDQIVAAGPAGVAELSGRQRETWRAGGGRRAVLMRLRGPLDAGVLRGALAALIARHQSLRTSFVERDGSARQLVAPPPGRSWWEELDLSGVPEPVRERRARQLIGDSWGHPFDLRHAPLLRACLVRLATAEHLFGYAVHPLAADDWSLPILAAELSELYSAAVEDREPELPAHPVQPGDVYRWQRDRLASEGVQRRIGARREQLAGMPRLAGLSGRPRPIGGALRTAELALPAELMGRADELARSAGRTRLAVLLAAFAVLLRQRTGQHDLAIGTVFSGRVRSEMAPLIGCFANTGVLRVEVAPDQSVADLVAHCQQSVLEAQQVQDIPFGEVAGEAAPGTGSLLQVGFTLTGREVGAAPLDLPGVAAEPLDAPPAVGDFGIACQVAERADGSSVLRVLADGELFDDPTVRDLAAGYLAVLAAMLPATGAGELAVEQLVEAARVPDMPEAAPHDPAGLPELTDPVELSGPVDPAARAGTLRDHLARIWAEVFSVPGDFDDDQSFFEVGGTSILAVRLRARLLSEFGVDLDLADIVAGGSVTELVGYLEAALAADEPAPPDSGGG